ncbi:carboxypeptidase M32 [Desulfurococcaceae archaeon MEX13E-LK6-19]|nr:carboxypeptidase M32 [Desulfurococcaceae archaeon MEX13E-LK6-19]
MGGVVGLFSRKKIIKEILDYYRKIWAIGHALNLLHWDTETYMPEKGVVERSSAVAELSVLAQKLITDEKFVKLVEKAAELKDLNDYEKGLIRVLERTIRVAKKLPPRHVHEFAKVTQEAVVVWRNAKKANNYDLFKPYLKKIIELNREKAEYLGYKEHPYDALLDLYEEGMTTREVEEVFRVLEPGVKKILERVLEEKTYPQTHPLEEVEYNIRAMKRVNERVLRILGYPFNRARLDESAHPFTIHMGIFDVRITTRYEGKDFKRSLLGTVHEFGHALYQLQIDKRFSMTPLTEITSLGLHESQSRFWENIIGRSMGFVETIYPILAKSLRFIKNYSPNDIYLYFNTVKPSLIRTEADEVTYNLHIILRFKLEKLMITGEVKADELPELWNQEMERLLGIKPKTYSEGVLQDIHWSMGSIGYFPTYSLGTILAAQIKYHAEKQLGNIDEIARERRFKQVREYLREKIHRWGSVYPPKELLQRSFGETINPEYFIKYLEEKYLQKQF